MGHTTINQKAAIAAEMAVKATATTAAVAEVHTTINQKGAAIAAEMAVEAAATAAAVAEAKTAAKGAAATSRRQLWQRQGQAAARADNNEPKSGRNGGQGSGIGNSCGRGEDSGRGVGGNMGADSFGNNGGRQRRGQTTINQKAAEWRSLRWQRRQP